MNKVIKTQVQSTKQDEDRIKVNVVISDDSVDRDNDVVVQAGLNTDNYLKNPVVLYMHQRGNVIGRINKIRKLAKRHDAEIEFTSEEENPTGYSVGKLFQNKFINAVSI